MALAALVVLTVLSLAVLLLAAALFVSIGEKQLHTPVAIANDGPRTGRAAPPLDLRTIDGTTVAVPGGRRQVLLFADHSLMDFEELLAALTEDGPDLADRPDVVVLGSVNRTSADLLRGLELRVPVAVVPHEIYDRYRVRVMPYAVVVDAAGRVATSGLVNTPFQLRHLAQVGLETEPAGTPGTRSGAAS